MLFYLYIEIQTYIHYIYCIIDRLPVFNHLEPYICLKQILKISIKHFLRSEDIVAQSSRSRCSYIYYVFWWLVACSFLHMTIGNVGLHGRLMHCWSFFKGNMCRKPQKWTKFQSRKCNDLFGVLLKEWITDGKVYFFQYVHSTLHCKYLHSNYISTLIIRKITGNHWLLNNLC